MRVLAGMPIRKIHLHELKPHQIFLQATQEKEGELWTVTTS